MNKRDIEDIKKSGAETGLLDAVRDRLWGARLALEEAVKDKCRNCQPNIDKARALIEEAEACWNETYTL